LGMKPRESALWPDGAAFESLGRQRQPQDRIGRVVEERVGERGVVIRPGISPVQQHGWGSAVVQRDTG